MAVGVGMMGLSPRDLYDLELVEFNAAYAGWLRMREQTMRNDWERTRWSTARLAACWLDKQADIMKLFPLPWDKPSAGEVEEKEITPEERRRRVEEILSRRKIKHDEQEVSIANH